MKIVLDPSFAGESGMLKVWNATNGAIQVTDEGHLLDAHKTAWVEESAVLTALIESGHASVIGESVSPKKVTKSKAKPEEPLPIESPTQDNVPVVPVDEPQTEENV